MVRAQKFGPIYMLDRHGRASPYASPLSVLLLDYHHHVRLTQSLSFLHHLRACSAGMNPQGSSHSNRYYQSDSDPSSAPHSAGFLLASQKHHGDVKPAFARGLRPTPSVVSIVRTHKSFIVVLVSSNARPENRLRSLHSPFNFRQSRSPPLR